MIVTSPHNPGIKRIRALRQRRSRESAGVILVEGYDEIHLALRSGAEARQVYFSSNRLHSEAGNKLLSLAARAGAELVEVTDQVFRTIAYRQNPDGWLATVSTINTSLDNLSLVRPSPLIIIADAVEKPGNLGAMLRTADAASVDAVIACDPVTDWGNPNVVRASKGTIFSVPLAEGTHQQVVAWLRRGRIRIVAASPTALTSYTDTELTGPLALVVGAENQGLGREWLQESTATVRLPMAGQVNSLNVATTMAILTYEALRQRSTAEPPTS